MGYYYLHSETKDLIWRRYRINPTESDFVLKAWECDTSNRKDAWTIILEGLALGALENRVKELCRKWKCDIDDFKELIVRMKEPTLLMQKGATIFLERIAGLDADIFWDTIKEQK